MFKIWKFLPKDSLGKLKMSPSWDTVHRCAESCWPWSFRGVDIILPFYCLLLRRVAAVGPRKGAIPKSMASDVEIREGR